MDITINQSNLYGRSKRYNSPSFKGKEQEENTFNYQSNLNGLIKYFRTNADVYLKPIVEDKDSGQQVMDLAAFDYDKTTGMLDAVKKYIRGQIIKNGKVEYEDEYLADLSNIKGALEIDNLSPNAFFDLINLASNKKRVPNLDVYGTISALNSYDVLKTYKSLSPEQVHSIVEYNLGDDTVLLTKEEVESLPEDSELFNFKYVKDLKNSSSKEELVKKIKQDPFNDATIFIPTALIAFSNALVQYNRAQQNELAKQEYSKIKQEYDSELIESHERCTETLKKILTDFGSKVEFSENEYVPYDYEAVFGDIYDEMSAWKEAGGDEFLHGKIIDITDFDIYDIRRDLREELTGHNDLKFMSDIHMTNNFGLSDEDAVRKILNERMYEDEFLKAGVEEELIDEAYEDTTAFISVAARGNFSEYSDEFKQVLVDFGMPEWELNLPDLE